MNCFKHITEPRLLSCNVGSGCDHDRTWRVSSRLTLSEHHVCSSMDCCSSFHVGSRRHERNSEHIAACNACLSSIFPIEIHKASGAPPQVQTGTGETKVAVCSRPRNYKCRTQIERVIGSFMLDLDQGREVDNLPDTL